MPAPGSTASAPTPDAPAPALDVLACGASPPSAATCCDAPAPALDVLAPDVLAPDVLAPDVLAPDVLAPDVLAPDVLAPDAPAFDAATPDAAPAVEWRVTDGLLPYPDALAAMQARAGAIRDGAAGELVWLVEHPPTYTAGTSARPEELRDPHRFPAFAAGRGGQWTYHGPGQRTAYALLDLTRRHGTVPPRDVRAYVHGLEEWLIRALDRFDVRGERRAGRVGIWVADRAAGTEAKIAAIGVRVTRWVSWHGVALNVEPDLSHFGGIVPCGISEHGVTSLHALGLTVTMAEADSALRAAWAEVFG